MLFQKDLWLKLLNYYIVPEDQPSLSLLSSRTMKVQQTLFNQGITMLFASWIDKKSPTYTSEHVRTPLVCAFLITLGIRPEYDPPSRPSLSGT